MGLRLAADRVLAVARARGIDGVGELATLMGVHRSTLSRWFSAKAPVLPGSSDQVLALAKALDVDPILLFRVDPERYPRLCARIVRAIHSGDWNQAHPALQFARSLLVPSATWPPPDFATPTRRPWVCRDLPLQPADRGVGYVALEIAFHPFEQSASAADGPWSPPRAWHLAFQDTAGLVPQLTRPFGYVQYVDGAFRLTSARGFFMFDGTGGGSADTGDMAATASASVSLQVQVWSDGRSGNVRVASLHPFKARWVPSEPSSPPAGERPCRERCFRFCEQGFPCIEPGTSQPCVFSPRCTSYRVPSTLESSADPSAPSVAAPPA